MYPVDLLKYLDADWGSREAILVAFPCPPRGGKDVFYAPDAWASSSLDSLQTAVQMEGFEFLGSSISEFGPAVAFKARLGQFIFNQAIDRMFCARVEYYTLFETPQTVYATQARIVSLTPIGQSCHSQSHFVAPRSLFLTALLSTLRPIDNAVLASTEFCETLFPTIDFTTNVDINPLFSFLTLTDVVGTSRVATGIVTLPTTIPSDLRAVVVNDLVFNETHRIGAPEQYVPRIQRIRSLMEVSHV